jgi:adenine-specific DNA-methyltransferase
MEKITKDHPLSKSEDIMQTNIETLKKLFPTIVKEGKIDLKELEALLSDEIETGDEYYRFTWVTKSEARREANKPTTATLLPDKAGSKNWETTKNIFIEGDNLEVLKLLQKSYPNQIKLIYIDPPYNTGTDFVYKDNYNDNLGNYLALTKQTDEEGKKLSTNTESDGRYHSNWLSMMYPRLKLARNLMKDDGVMLISIDDNEIINLGKLIEEIFGGENFEIYVWDVREDGTLPKTAKKTVRKEHEYLVAVFKSRSNIKLNKYTDFKYLDKEDWGNPDNDPRGPWMSGNISRGSGEPSGGSKSFTITNPQGIAFNRDWAITEDEFKELLDDNRIFFANDGNGVPRKKIFKNESTESIQSSLFENLTSSQTGKKEIKDLIKEIDFDYPKPVKFISRIIQLVTNKDEEAIVLDFFAGSGTTGHSLMLQNSLDGGNRQFICVQLQEKLDSDSNAYKAGYKTIANITKERINRAGDKILAELKEKIASENKKNEIKFESKDPDKKSFEQIISKLDIGFRSFKLDTSNINAWDGSVDNFGQNLLNTETNIKIDRTEDDVLFEVLLKYGLNLTVPIEEKNIAGCKVYSVGAGVLFVCLADNITIQVAEEIGKWKEQQKPTNCRVLFKDNGFKDDVAKTNSVQILKRFGIEEINSL